MTFSYPSPVAPKRGRVWWQRQAVAAAPAVLSFILATGVFLVGWRGVDQAAQTYRVLEFKLHGFMLWDSNWYGGNFPLGYSVLYPAMAAVIGTEVVAVASAVLATWSFDRVIRSYLGARPIGTYYFAVSTLLPVAIGQWPFLAGEAVGLSALVVLQRGKRPLAVGLGILAALLSPLAAAFLALVCVAWAAQAAGRRKWMIATAAFSLAVIVVTSVLFPGTGPMPYPWTSLVPTELLCLTALTPLVKTTPAVRLGALFYAVASFFSWLVPNPLGGNAPRLAASIGVPLLACLLTAPGPALGRLNDARPISWLAKGRSIRLTAKWRVAAIAIVIPFAVWQWAPGQQIVTSSTVPGTQESYYKPLLAELALLSPRPVRVEVVPTQAHWESAFVAPSIPLARGWERQLDVADNPLFYDNGALTPASYRAWLTSNGVSYVALPNAPLDYAAKGEADLLHSGLVTNLVPLWSTPDWQLWGVSGTPGLVTGPASLVSLEPDHLTLRVASPGLVTVRVRYTKFWSVTYGAACVAPGEVVGPASSPTAVWTSVDALSAGFVELSATVVHQAPASACPASS
jgi:hypothetical protein